ncbi:MFS transporter [Pseudomonas alcaligenes]|uniref:MFS transporter n=2 Tax=Aquipseudomonas alcaligenes TaxID=43263 RepID=A0ABR7S2W0_AQUAC|nr:MFS transporter [Pseudomonas alcaligenes]
MSNQTRWALLGLALVMLLSSLGISSANVALPTLARAFGVSFQAVQWVVLAYLLSSTCLVVGAGRLGDLFGRRRVLLGGILLFSAASLLCSLAASFWVLLLARAAQGLGAASMLALSMSFVAELVPAQRAGSAMGLLGTLSALGTALGPSLGGGLLAVSGWPAIFLVNLPLGLLAAWLAWRYLPRAQSVAASRQSFDLLGLLLLALSLAAYALAMTLGRGHFGGLNLLLLGVAGTVLMLFVRLESRLAAPLIHLASLGDAQLSCGLLMSGLVATVMMASLVVGPFYLATVLALDASRVGLVMSAGPLLAALVGAPGGRLVDRLGPTAVLAGGLSAMLAGCGLLALLPSGYGVPGYLAPLLLVTAGYALFQAANNTAVMARGQAQQRGVLAALLNLARNLGLITGAAVLGAVFAATAMPAAGGHAAAEVAGGLQRTFAVAALLVGVALALLPLGRMLARRNLALDSAG